MTHLRPLNLDFSKILTQSDKSLRNLLLRAKSSVGTDVTGEGRGFVQERSFILGNVPQELERRSQNRIISATNTAFAALEKDFFSKFTEAVESQDFKFEQISGINQSIETQLGNFNRQQEDIERGIITSQSQINMGSQNNLLLIGAAVLGLFLIG